MTGGKLRPQFLPSILPDRGGGNHTLPRPRGAGCLSPPLVHCLSWKSLPARELGMSCVEGVFPGSSGTEGFSSGP